MLKRVTEAAFRRSSRLLRPRIYIAVTLVALGAGSAALAHHVDSMYPTANATWNCNSNGEGTGAGNFCQNDVGQVDWWADWAINQGEYEQIRDTTVQEFAPTDLTAFEVNAPIYNSGANNGETSVIYELRANVPFPAQGVTWCDRSFNVIRCDQTYVAFQNNSVINRALACHETGHAVGLTHGAQASPAIGQTDASLNCMKTPISLSDTTLGIHNVTQINAAY